MVADKVFTIQADFGGVGETPPIIDDDVLAKMEAQAERNAALLGTFIADSYGATGTPEDFKKKKGQAGRPKKDKTEDELKKAERNSSLINRILNNTQKVVIALNGTNGRVTKSMAVFNRAVKLSTEWIEKHAEAQKKSTETVEKATEVTAEAGEVAAAAGDGGDDGSTPEEKAAKMAASATASGLAKVAVGAAGVATVVGTVIAGFTALATVTFILGKLYTALVENLKDVVNGFSGALKMAEAQTKMATIQTQMRAANKVGGELASLEKTNNAVIQELITFKTEVVDALSGLIQFLGEVLWAILKVLNFIMKLINFILELIQAILLFIFRILDHIPLISSLVKPVKRWLEADQVGKIVAKGGIKSMLDPIGDLANSNLTKAEVKNLRKGGFLPPKPRRGGGGPPQ